MLTPHEIHACALEILKTHGREAPRHIAEQIGALALTGDGQGIATWRAIARSLTELMGLGGASGTRH